MERDRIDWTGLAPLPRKKRTGATKEDLAARKFNMAKAQHKGRCHVTNQKRRADALAKKKATTTTDSVRDAKFRSLKDRIRAFWRGETDEHP